MTWRDGEQMVGFALAHAYILFYISMLLSLVVAHLALACVISVTFARWLRKLPTPRCNWLVVGALAASLVLVHIPHDIWITTTVRIAGPGARGSSLLMMAAAENKLPLARILVAKGISPNATGGGTLRSMSRVRVATQMLLDSCYSKAQTSASHASSCVNLGISRMSSVSQ